MTREMATRRRSREIVRHRAPARLRTVVLLASIGAALVAWDRIATAEVADTELYTRGGTVFQANCAACHGTRGEGGPGPGILAGPPILGLDISYVDLVVRTGRMPIAKPAVGVYADQLGDTDREALAIYVQQRFGLDGAIPSVESGDASRGQELFVRNCAACHGAAGGGGITGGAIRVPPLVGIDGVAIAQATRVGPFEMPAFAPAVIDDEGINDLVGYMELVAATPRTPAGVREVNQITAALFAVGLGIVAIVVLLVVSQARRWYLHEPEGISTAPPFEPRS